MSTEMESALQWFEDVLVESKDPRLVGKEFTLADLFIQRLAVTHEKWKEYELGSIMCCEDYIESATIFETSCTF